MGFRGKLGSSKTPRQSSMRTEDSIAEKIGGQRVIGSGSLPSKKGDVSSKNYLIESKQTDLNSITVTRGTLRKICKESRDVGKTPAVVVTFNKSEFGVPNQWIMVPISEFWGIDE